MKCQNCGKMVIKNNRFCPACGQPIKVYREEPYLYKEALKFYQDRQYNKAEKNLFELILKHPSDSKFQNLLGCVYLQQGNSNLAVLHLEKASQLDPFSWQAYFNLGIIASNWGDFVRAKKMFGSVLCLKENHLPSIYNLGTILLKEGNYPAAIAQFSKAKKINPQHRNTQINLYLALKKLND